MKVFLVLLGMVTAININEVPMGGLWQLHIVNLVTASISEMCGWNNLKTLKNFPKVSSRFIQVSGDFRNLELMESRTLKLYHVRLCSKTDYISLLFYSFLFDRNAGLRAILLKWAYFLFIENTFFCLPSWLWFPLLYYSQFLPTSFQLAQPPYVSH